MIYENIMANIGTTFTKSGKKAVLCGSGELGKEVALELQRYGVEVVALDKYANAPAMHIAHSSHVLSMLDGDALKEVIKKENPDYIIPEIEAIATDKLVELEEEGFNVIPTAKASMLVAKAKGSILFVQIEESILSFFPPIASFIIFIPIAPSKIKAIQ